MQAATLASADRVCRILLRTHMEFGFGRTPDAGALGFVVRKDCLLSRHTVVLLALCLSWNKANCKVRDLSLHYDDQYANSYLPTYLPTYLGIILCSSPTRHLHATAASSLRKLSYSGNCLLECLQLRRALGPSVFLVTHHCSNDMYSCTRNSDSRLPYQFCIHAHPLDILNVLIREL